jgi:hypothetical protein
MGFLSLTAGACNKHRLILADTAKLYAFGLREEFQQGVVNGYDI